jgi:hypothetical protein
MYLSVRKSDHHHRQNLSTAVDYCSVLCSEAKGWPRWTKTRREPAGSLRAVLEFPSEMQTRELGSRPERTTCCYKQDEFEGNSHSP